MDYSVEFRKNSMPMNEFKRRYQDREKFIAYCRECPRYDTVWSCPPLSFDADEYLKRFSRVSVVGAKPDSMRRTISQRSWRPWWQTRRSRKEFSERDDEIARLEAILRDMKENEGQEKSDQNQKPANEGGQEVARDASNTVSNKADKGGEVVVTGDEFIDEQIRMRYVSRLPSNNISFCIFLGRTSSPML